MGGFEGADHRNAAGTGLCMDAVTEHGPRLDEDYRRAARLGLRTVRESVGWRLSENEAGVIDLARVERMARCAAQHGLQILWTVMHYGLPEDLNLHDDALIARFARFAGEVASALRPLTNTAPIYTPINEISFLAWAGSATDMMGRAGQRSADAPFVADPGYALKRRLVRAALAGMAAMRAADPRTRFMHMEPIVRVVAPAGNAALQADAARFDAYQWQALDMLSGRLDPELGGQLTDVDLIGFNHYHSSQWEHGTGAPLTWDTRDPRRVGLADLLGEAWQRYGRPMIVGETSHVGVGRAAWLHEVAGEVLRAREAGIPVHGICLYPLLDRPDWNNTAHWHRSGMWHLAGDGATSQSRVLNRPYARALAAWRDLPDRAIDAPKPALLLLSPLDWADAHERLEPLLTRLAREYQIVFITSRADAPSHEPRLRRYTAAPGVELVLIDGGAPGASAALRDFIASLRSPACTAWVIGNDAQALLRQLPIDVRVHEPLHADDRLDAADAADAVVTRGPAQHVHWQARHGAVVIMAEGSALWPDAAHDMGGYEDEEVQRILSPISRPRLIYIGPIDARLDLALIADLARLRPALQWLLVGPLIGLAGQPLPQAPNLHWLGGHAPSLLPGLVNGCAAGFLPYRMDASTAHLSPTQIATLRAAGKAVVVTALTEVIADGSMLQTAGDAKAFALACDRAIDRSGQRTSRRAIAREWDERAAQISTLLQGLIAARAP